MDLGAAFWEPYIADDIATDGSIWDTLTIDGEAVPGICAVSGTLKFDVEVKKAKGKDKASTTDNGIAPTEFEVRIQLWTQEQWADYVRVASRLLPRTPGGARTPVRVDHPGLRICGIGKAVVREFEIPQPPEAGKIFETRIKFIEWVPAAAVVTKKSGGTGSPSAPKKPFDPFGPEPPLLYQGTILRP
jgi:hypothetical protein